MVTETAPILKLFDAGKTPKEIAAASQVAIGTVYATLRAHRPDRRRAPRTLTSIVPAGVVGLHKAGVKVARIAQLLQVSRAYVYQILKSQEQK